MKFAQSLLQLASLGALAGFLVTGSPSLAAEPAPAQLVAVIKSADASANEKAIALQDLAAYGGPDAVRALSRLLDHPEFSHYARYALQTNPAPEAAAALREASARLDGDLRVGVINTIGARGDEQAVRLLANFMHSDDRSVAIAAAGALAAIGSDTALSQLKTLTQSRLPEFADPLLECARAELARGNRDAAISLFKKIENSEAPVAARRAAAIGICEASAPANRSDAIAQLLQADLDWKFEAGIQAAVQESGPVGAAALATALDDSPAARQQQLLAAIKARGDSAALPAVRKATFSDDPTVRMAAIAALGSLGAGADVERLAEIATADDPSVRAAAITSLTEMDDAEADRVMIELLHTSNPSSQALAAQVLGLRRSGDAGPALMDLATSSDNSAVRLSALEALKRLAPPEELPELLDLLPSLNDDAEQSLAKEAILAAGLRVTDRDRAASEAADRIESWEQENRQVLFDLLRVVGGARALQVVTAAAESPDRSLQDAATRVLGGWGTPDAAPVLLELSTPDYPFHVRSLRGYLRIARQMNLDDETRIAMCRKALAIASRPDERKLALELLQRFPSVDSLQLAVAQLDPQLLGTDASEAVVALAEQIAEQHPQEARQAAQQVIDTGAADEVISRARKILGQAT